MANKSAVSLRFDKWLQDNPNQPFSKFYAQDVEAQLDDGTPHATLGDKLKWEASFAVAGLDVFAKLRSFGLTEKSVCVDYGCGTLRVGQHVIRYLPQCAYWGLDISAKLLDRGQQLIGDSIIATKRPNFRVINPKNLLDAAACKPDFVFSNAVLMHVHPDELPDYVRNLISLIDKDGQVVFSARCSRHTLHYYEKSWTYGHQEIFDAFADQGASLEELASEPAPVEGAADCKRYWFRARQR
jgi:SAM-dependent methyltransferase